MTSASLSRACVLGGDPPTHGGVDGGQSSMTFANDTINLSRNNYLQLPCDFLITSTEHSSVDDSNLFVVQHVS